MALYVKIFGGFLVFAAIFALFYNFYYIWWLLGQEPDAGFLLYIVIDIVVLIVGIYLVKTGLE